MRRAALFALIPSFLAVVVFDAGNAFSFLVFVILVAGNAFSFWLCGIRYRQCSSHFGFVELAAGNALLLSAVCGIRYRRGPSTVRNTHSVLKTGSCGTRRIFRGIRCKKQAFPVQKRYSVRRTASCGTRRIMDIRYSPPPSLVRNRSLDAKKGHHRNNTKKQDKSCDLSCLVAGAGLEPTTSGL